MELDATVADVPDGSFTPAAGVEGDTIGTSISTGFDAASSAPPQQIGRYRLVRELGRGGMGLVYVAEDLRLGRQIALKILPQQLAGDPRAFRRFQDEARLLAQMNHPNIAIIHSLEAEEPLQFLTMELIPGETLQSRLAKGALPVGEWFVVSRQIGAALEAAHANGIIHLDLKPGNVIITPDGVVKVLDFGLAMAPGREADAAEGTRTRARAQEGISGTPGYMSPEQAMGKSVDSRADVFAFGSVLYEAIAGHAAFEGANIEEKVRATMTREPDLSDTPPEFPETMRDLIRRCLVKDANRRLASITQALEELDRALTASGPARARVTPTNLPLSLSNFVGRARAKEEALDLLKVHPILTVTGVGGGGKTRFALEVGRELLPAFPDGVWLVEIAPLAEESRVPAELRTVLGIKEEVGRDLIDTLVDHLTNLSTLLIFDGCERFLKATADLVHALLRRCPNVRAVCTSRGPLGLSGETVYQLPVLAVPRGASVPPTLEELSQVEAVQLFVDRASATQPAFKLTAENAGAVLQICQRLDGIPLALELAAARIRVLSPGDIARRLDDRFRLLTSSDRGVMPYHQTLRALIDWSHDHLSPAEQSVFRRLAVFAGGWTLEAAERICTGPGLDEWALLDHLSSLLEKCLVEMDSDAGHRTGHTRYRMLETIRAYARQKLSEAGEEPSVRVAHRELFLALAEEAEPQLTGPEQSSWLTRLAEDHDNFLVALEIDDPAGGLETRLALAGALGRYWHMRGHWNEARSIYARLLDAGVVPETPGAASALNWAGNLSKSQSDYASAAAYHERALELRRRLGDRAGVARSLYNLGTAARDLGDTARARALYQEGLELLESLGNRAGVAQLYHGLGALALQARDRPLARSFFEQSLAIRRELRNPGEIAGLLGNLGWIATVDGRLDDAVALCEESLTIYRELGSRTGMAAVLYTFGELAVSRKELERARAYYEESLAIHRELGDRQSTARALRALAALHGMMGRFDDAHRLYLESAEILAGIGDRTTLSRVLADWAALHADQGQDRRGVQLLAAAESLQSQGALSIDQTSDRWERARKRMGDREFDACYESGRIATIPEALSLARLAAGPGGDA